MSIISKVLQEKISKIEFQFVFVFNVSFFPLLTKCQRICGINFPMKRVMTKKMRSKQLRKLKKRFFAPFFRPDRAQDFQNKKNYCFIVDLLLN
jgi:hypothetical protein